MSAGGRSETDPLVADLVEAIAERAAAIVLARLRDEAPSDESGDELLSVAEVACQCQVTPKVVYGAIERGELLASRLGPRRLRVRPSAVEAWIAATRVEPARSVPARIPARRPRRRGRPKGAGLARMLAPDDPRGEP